jgi:lysophospholipase L1-like esterase
MSLSNRHGAILLGSAGLALSVLHCGGPAPGPRPDGESRDANHVCRSNVVDLDGKCPAKTLAAGGPEFDIDWSVPARTIYDRDHLQPLKPPKDFVTPSLWPVQLNACRTKPGANGIAGYRWDLVSEFGEPYHISSPVCIASLYVKNLGNYQTDLTITDNFGAEFTATKTILVHDYLIVSMGDSISSGEGNPDRDKEWLPPFESAKWDDKQCHRSWNSGAAKAAVVLEEADPRTSVTFISVACSGAGLQEGLLEPWAGKEPDGRPPLERQIDQVRDLVADAGRSIHAILLQAGANDVGFGMIARSCLLDPITDCNEQFFTDIDTNDYVATTFVQRQLARLPARYQALNDKFEKLPYGYNKVYISEYHDPLHGKTGGLCEVDVVDVNGSEGAVLWPWESKWAYETVMLPLNQEVQKAADKHGWAFVGGIASEFLTHGICAHEESWTRTIPDSLFMQGDSEGSLHPNGEGHNVIANHILQTVWPSLQPIGADVSCPWGRDSRSGLCMAPPDPDGNGACFDRCDNQLITCYGHCQGADAELCMCLCDNNAIGCCSSCGGVECGQIQECPF